MNIIDRLLERGDPLVPGIRSKCGNPLIILCLREVEGQDFPVVLMNRQISKEQGPGPIVERRENGAWNKDHVRIQPGETLDFTEIELRAMGHKGREFFAVFQEVSERGNPVGDLCPVVVVKEKNAEPSQAGHGDKVFRAVCPVAEGCSEVHEAGNRKIIFGRGGWDRDREEEKNEELEEEQIDPF
jgi:hypothetical protein